MTAMKRNAFIMHLKPGNEAEYKRRHDEIWPELEDILRSAGISNYSIYLDRNTNTLFAFQILTDNATDNELPANSVVRKWWDFMKDLMETNPDNSPVCDPLIEVFHMD